MVVDAVSAPRPRRMVEPSCSCWHRPRCCGGRAGGARDRTPPEGTSNMNTKLDGPRRETSVMRRTILVATMALAMVAKPAPSAAQCPGDLNGDFSVTVDELITAVRSSLDQCTFSGPRFSDNRDGTVRDQKTGLMWEKKADLDGSPNPSDPHDAD